MLQGKKPERVVVGLVKSKALNGDYTTNPFNFGHCNITKIAVYNDGLKVGGNPIKTDFSKTNSTITRAYTNLLLRIGKWRQDEGFGSHFKSGSTLFAFQSEPNFLHHGEYLSLVKNGNSRLEIQFSKVLAEPMSCIVYSEEPGYMELTNERSVVLQSLIHRNLSVVSSVTKYCLLCDRLQQSYRLIVNTDKYSDPGLHWCAIFNDGHGHIEFFDSYGRPPEENSVLIWKWIRETAKTWSFNPKQLHSTVCGLYSLLYLRFKCLGGTMEEFINLFYNSDFFVNDSFVYNMSLECVKTDCRRNQVCCALDMTCK